MTSLSLPDDRYFQLDYTADPFTMYAAFDGARISLRLTGYAQGGAAAQRHIPVTVSATLLAGCNSNPGDMKALTVMRSESLIHAQATPSSLTLTGHVSVQALREVEAARHGGDLHLVLGDLRLASLTNLDGQPATLFESVNSPNLPTRVHSSAWAEQYAKVTASSYVDVLIPVTDDPELLIAAGRVREAQEHIRRGQFNAAAAPLRQALEPVRTFYKTLAVHGQAVPKAPKQRDVDERFSIYVQGLFAWITSFVHDDGEAIEGADLERTEAVQALTAVAGLLHRLAQDRAAAGL